MGLEEKRSLKKLQEEVFPKYQKELNQLAGIDIQMKVDWDSFSNDLRAMKFFEHQGLKYVVNAVKAICHDDLGREALKEGVREIGFLNIEDPAGKMVSFENGVVLVKGSWARAGYPLEADIRRSIENSL